MTKVIQPFVILGSLVFLMVGCKPTLKSTDYIQPMERQCIDATVTYPDGTVETVRINTDDPNWIIMNTQGFNIEQ